MKPLIAGNWKMNGLQRDGLALAEALVDAAGKDRPACDILICPPATLIGRVAAAVAGSALMVGGQDCHGAAKGAHTGDVSAEMLADLGCRAVIVGHSERRDQHGETDELVRAKAEAAWRAGLLAIICVGETLGQRESGQAEIIVRAQVTASVPDGASAENTVVAYEPVWAIGTGRTPSPADVSGIHSALRGTLADRFPGGEAMRLLYGGSVNAANAPEMLGVPGVDGALVGGASLQADAFWSIVRAAGSRD